MTPPTNPEPEPDFWIDAEFRALLSLAAEYATARAAAEADADGAAADGTVPTT